MLAPAAAARGGVGCEGGGGAGPSLWQDALAAHTSSNPGLAIVRATSSLAEMLDSCPGSLMIPSVANRSAEPAHRRHCRRTRSWYEGASARSVGVIMVRDGLTHLVTEDAVRDLLDALLSAQTEDDVHSCLDRAGVLDDAYWLPYGGQSNNSGTFLNQQADARGALIEKIVNSIDAVLTRHAYEKGDFESGNLPESMFEAAERYFNVRDGKLHNITRAERSRLAAQSVQVVFTGDRRRPTITVVDQGEGQTPRRFPETFLSLSADNKRKIPFVQGKFNMGSAGAVPFCGTEHHYQLILSRRYPAATEADGRWGFTVVRRRRPEADEKTSIFQYLAPDGEVLSLHVECIAPLGARIDRCRPRVRLARASL